MTPSLKLTHEGSKKHREWLFRKLSWEFLELTEQREKVEVALARRALARQMKTIVCV
jgi:hypothetical protein